MKAIQKTELSAGDSKNEMGEYWEAGFHQYKKKPGTFYNLNNLPQITQASHHRRIKLLNSLPIGDVSDKVCVDYGVGPWGFGCIFHRLQNCKKAIGIDISEQAIRMSEEISRTGNFPYGRNYRYLTSVGNRIDLDDASVDIFFAGEAIEHVDDVAAFLDEVHRLLKPDGLVILTTPNADAYLYKINNERYCFNAEHISLMTYPELLSYLTPGFEVLTAKGFNGSFYRTFDNKITDPDLVSDWVSAFEDRPEMATGVIVMARKRADYHPGRHKHRYYHHTAPEIHYQGQWEVCDLYGPLTGVRGHPDQQSQLTLEFEGDGLLVDLWGHDWSGFAELEVDSIRKTVNLYSPLGGFYKVRFADLGSGSHKFTLSTTSERDTRSLDNQVILWRLISYRLDDQKSSHKSVQNIPQEDNQEGSKDKVTNMSVHQISSQTTRQTQDETTTASKPATYQIPIHLSSIFNAPAEQLLPERLLIYSLIFGLKPKLCLEIGTHWGGSASIICAAMDDIDHGQLICIDPNPLIASETWEKIKHRTQVLPGMSPQILPRASTLAGGDPFDFALIDGDHTYNGVLRDIEGVIPYLNEQAYLLFHDCHYFEIEDAINEAIKRHPNQLIDCGSLSAAKAPENREVNGRPVTWGGLRLVCFTRTQGTIESDPSQAIQQQIRSLQDQLRLTQQKLAMIENSRTWQMSSKLAYSKFGRALSALLKRILR